MSEVETNSIDLLLPDFFIVAALAAWAPLAPLIGSRFAAMRDGFEPSEFLEEGEPDANAWPFVLFGPSEDGVFEMFAQTATLFEAPYLVRVLMREDYATARGEDFEDATAAVQKELQHALTAFGATEVTKENDEVRGIVHGCELLPQSHRRVYGERGRRVSEMGVHIRIFCN
ncbi:hypothetical protein EON80_13000 [bacterium]|nr:MAG: hypothetical protein EON80_13000 [bacterium]